MQEKYNQEKLSWEEFMEALQKQVTERLGEGFQVEQIQVRKNNGVQKETLLVRAENTECAPSFYLEEMYRSYCLGHPLEALSEHMTELVQSEYLGEMKDVKQVLERDWFEERLFLRLVNFEKNKDQLEQAVYVKIHDLAAVFYVLTEREAEGIKSFCLPKSAWERAELGTPEAYYDTILRNTERLFPSELMRIEDGLVQCLERDGKEVPEWLMQEFEARKQSDRPPLFYVLTNDVKINGAIAVFYPEILEGLQERFGRGFYLIPSSIHEMLVLVEPGESVEMLNQMVREVNETQVDPEEVLADHVYYYAREQGFCSQEA